MKPAVSSLYLALLIFASCHKMRDNTALPGLPGTWQEQEMAGQFAGTTYHISFMDDQAFRLRLTVFTDAIDPTNPCSNGGQKYIRGTYAVSGNLLSLSGRFTDSSFTVESPDCTGRADFREQHSMAGFNGQLLLDDERGDFNRIVLNRE